MYITVGGHAVPGIKSRALCMQDTCFLALAAFTPLLQSFTEEDVTARDCSVLALLAQSSASRRTGEGQGQIPGCMLSFIDILVFF